MTDSNKPTIAELMAQLKGTTNTANKALTHADRALREIDRVKKRFHTLVAEDHDSIVELQMKVQALEERGGNVSFASLLLAGFTTDEIRTIHAIKSDEDLTDEMVVQILLGMVRGIRKDVDLLNELAVVQVEETMKLRQNVGGLDSRVTRLEQAPAPIAATTSAQRKITRNEKWVIGLVSIFAMILWGARNFDSQITLNGQNVGTASTPGDSWYIVLAVGVGAFCSMLAFFYLVDFSSLKEKKLPKAKKVKVQQTKSTTPSPAPAATAVMPSSPKSARAPRTAKQEADDARRLLNMSDQELAALGSNTPAVFDQDEQIVIKPAQQPMQVSLD